MSFRLVPPSSSQNEITTTLPLSVECKWISAQDKRIGETWFNMHNIEDDSERVQRLSLTQYNQLCDKYCEAQSYKSLNWIPLPLTQFLETFTLQPIPSDEKLATLLPLGLWDKLRDFQKDGIRYGIQRKGCLLFGDEMGLGKTLQGLCVAYYHWILTPEEKRKPMVVIAARAAGTGWMKTCRESFGWTPENGMAFSMDTGKSRPNSSIHLPNIIFTTFDLLNQEEVYNWFHNTINPQQIIVDESHLIKNAKAQRTNSVHKLIEHASQRILCSGTPTGSKPVELYTSLKMTQPDLYPVFMQSRKPKTPRELSFAWRYCDPRRNKFSKGWEYLGNKQTEELHYVLSSVMMVRRTTEKVDPELEKLKIRQQVHISVTPEFEAYFKAEKGKIHQLRDKRPDQAKYKFMELWRLCSRAKLPSMLEEIREFLLRGAYAQKPKLKCIIFAYHNIVLDTVQQLLDCYKIKYIRIDGKTSVNQRKEREEQFQSREDGTSRVALINMKAGGHSITLTTADVELFLEYHPDINTLLQAEKRAHRIGRAEPVLIQYYHADNTPDDNIWNLLMNKLRNSSLILDGYVRHFHALYCDSSLHPPKETGGDDNNEEEQDDDKEKEEKEEGEQWYAMGVKKKQYKRKAMTKVSALSNNSFIPPPPSSSSSTLSNPVLSSSFKCMTPFYNPQSLHQQQQQQQQPKEKDETKTKCTSSFRFLPPLPSPPSPPPPPTSFKFVFHQLSSSTTANTQSASSVPPQPVSSLS